MILCHIMGKTASDKGRSGLTTAIGHKASVSVDADLDALLLVEKKLDPNDLGSIVDVLMYRHEMAKNSNGTIRLSMSRGLVSKGLKWLRAEHLSGKPTEKLYSGGIRIIPMVREKSVNYKRLKEIAKTYSSEKKKSLASVWAAVREAELEE
jgi:hypothetical protein